MFFLQFFLLGNLLMQSAAYLPSKNVMLCVLGICLLLFRYRKLRFSILLMAFLLGFLYPAWYAQTILSWSLPHVLEGKPVIVRGYVVSLPKPHAFYTSFLFVMQSINNLRIVKPVLINLSNTNLLLNLQVGDEWQFAVKLKRIHSIQNPGAFDYEAYSLQNHIRAAGNIVNHSENKFIAHHFFYAPIPRIRQIVANHLQPLLPTDQTSKWLPALILGERNNINPAEWEILRKTGTNHLMAIAGLHIGMMAMIAYYFMVRLWKCFPALLLRLPASKAGHACALLVAWIYSLLAGFSIPSARASIMLTLYLSAKLMDKRISVWRIWSVAFAFVLLINPLVTLSTSVWLSFGTIALIIYGMDGRLQPNGIWWRWGRVQWVVGFGLIPLSLFFFQECSLISFIANCFAIPLLSFVILPLCLSACVFLFLAPSVTQFILIIASKALSFLWLCLTYLASLPYASFYAFVPNIWVFISLLISILLFLLPSGLPGRWLGLVWLIPLIAYTHPRTHLAMIIG